MGLMNGIYELKGIGRAELKNQSKAETNEKIGAIEFPQSPKTPNAGKRTVKINKDGSRTVKQYDDTGATYTEKTYHKGLSGKEQMYIYKKYDANTGKLMKDADYDFCTGKLYQSSEYKDNVRIDKFYDEDGLYTGKQAVINEKDGSTRIDRFDENGNYQGSTIQSKIEKTGSLGGKSTITEIDAKGNVIKTREDEIGIQIGSKMIRM